MYNKVHFHIIITFSYYNYNWNHYQIIDDTLEINISNKQLTVFTDILRFDSR